MGDTGAMRQDQLPVQDGSAPAFATVTCLASIDPSRNRYRSYRLVWQPALWGGGALVRSWGRRGTQGRSQVTFYPSEDAAQTERERILRVRARHGYQPVAGGRPGLKTNAARQGTCAGKIPHPASAWWWLASLPANTQLPLL